MNDDGGLYCFNVLEAQEHARKVEQVRVRGLQAQVEMDQYRVTHAH
ncbi:hypothetical protein AB0L70_35650 [Kribbella sp. NPDC051952]